MILTIYSLKPISSKLQENRLSNNKPYPQQDWHKGTYTFDLQYEPESLKKLGEIYFEYGNPKNIEFADYVRNMLTKIGFMMFSRDLLKESIKGKQISTHYHLSSFIFNSKAYLDAISNMLNLHYGICAENAFIDIQKKSFRDKLRNKNQTLTKEIEKQLDWIDNVVSWRTEMIHRKSPLIIYYSEANDAGNAPKDITVKMPIEPVSMFNYYEDEKRIKSKYGKIQQDILPFCDIWIQNADKLLQITCQNIVNDITKPN